MEPTRKQLWFRFLVVSTHVKQQINQHVHVQAPGFEYHSHLSSRDDTTGSAPPPWPPIQLHKLKL